VNVAVAGVHVQGDEYAPVEHALVHGVALGENLGECRADKNACQLRMDFGFPADSDAAILEPVENASRSLGGLSDSSRL